LNLDINSIGYGSFPLIYEWRLKNIGKRRIFVGTLDAVSITHCCKTPIMSSVAADSSIVTATHFLLS